MSLLISGSHCQTPKDLNLKIKSLRNNEADAGNLLVTALSSQDRMFLLKQKGFPALHPSPNAIYVC